jgi:hypothetical protein
MPKKMKWQMNAGKIQEEIRWLISIRPEDIPAIRKPEHPDYKRFERIFNIVFLVQKKNLDTSRIVNAIGWDDGKIEMTFRN